MDSYNTTFADNADLQAGDLVVCTGTQMGAPKRIMGKVFVLENADGVMGLLPRARAGGQPMPADIYEGEDARWRKATISDISRSIGMLVPQDGVVVISAQDLETRVIMQVSDWVRNNPTVKLVSDYAADIERLDADELSAHNAA